MRVTKRNGGDFHKDTYYDDLPEDVKERILKQVLDENRKLKEEDAIERGLEHSETECKRAAEMILIITLFGIRELVQFVSSFL
jgi:hypothetical protein